MLGTRKQVKGNKSQAQVLQMTSQAQVQGNKSQAQVLQMTPGGLSTDIDCEIESTRTLGITICLYTKWTELYYLLILYEVDRIRRQHSSFTSSEEQTEIRRQHLPSRKSKELE